MPAFLGLLCRGGMVVGPLILISFLIPADWRVNGQSMSYAEFWRSGAGASDAIFVLLVTGGVWGMAARTAWSRWCLVLSQILPFIPFPRALSPDPLLTVAAALLGAVIIYVCLFHIPSIRRYMESGEHDRSAA